MAIQNATDVVLSITTADGLEAVAHCTSASLSVNMDLRDSTTKSSSGWSESLGGLKSWEMSGDAFVDLTSTNASMADCFDALIAGAAVAAVFTIDSETYTGTALITSVSADAGVEENTTFSVSLTGTAALVRA